MEVYSCQVLNVLKVRSQKSENLRYTFHPTPSHLHILTPHNADISASMPPSSVEMSAGIWNSELQTLIVQPYLSFLLPYLKHHSRDVADILSQLLTHPDIHTIFFVDNKNSSSLPLYTPFTYCWCHSVPGTCVIVTQHSGASPPHRVTHINQTTVIAF